MDLELKKETKKSKTKYEKCEKLGEGTYGVVYKATDLETNDVVAIKKMKIESDVETGISSVSL